jgi:glycosyltransferase involved in cell wall biosynthesis
MKLPLITVQLCTYNRRALLGRVMQALFDQDIDPADYEIVLVDDGSTDGTYEAVISQLRPTCALTVVRLRNGGLARGRNAGIERARGEFIMFMDDDVLATPGLLAGHLRCHRAHPRAICRGGVINVASLDDLPPARYTWRN